MESRTRRFLRSLLAGGRQDLVRIEEFHGKIAAVRAAGRECDLLVVARTEASIADLGLRRGAEAGPAGLSKPVALSPPSA
jgi:phosphoenolpyruvate phosphomutase